uniref:properdin-like isoform X1 n=2 Tax=Pristiophorus japonicus TaxID=55135 RepID=UPI00398EDEC5
MGDPALVLSTLCLLATSAGATVGRCFSGVNTRLGVCTDLIGDGIEEHDCCLNINYCFQAGHNGNSQPCRHAAEWTDWSAWSGCTVSCREGVQQRRRRCYGKGSCRGDEVLQTRPCTDRDCCIDNGGWSGWAGWSACSVTCASGQQQRQRTCSQPPPSCGGQCPGSGLEHRHCDTQQICPIHGSWSLWGSWTACGQSCRQERSRLVPVRRRTRVCNSPAPSTFPPGNSCTGGSMDTNQCNFLPFCPVAGNWGSWSAVSLCSTTCGIGKIQQQRRCDSPAPKHGGTACPGNANSNIHCNTKIACPVDGSWGEWSEWEECRRDGYQIACRDYVGSQSRSRFCLGLANDGNPCPGTGFDFRACYNAEDCQYDKGTWTGWNAWSLCYPPCGQPSKRSRNRSCIPIYPSYPNKTDSPVHFWGEPFYECDELQGQLEKVQDSIPCHNVPDCV